MALLTGKIALITGASRGIGRATARALSDAGAAVYLAADGTREELSTVAAECRAQNAFARAEFGMFDLSDIEDVRRMVDAALASFGSSRLEAPRGSSGAGARSDSPAPG